MASGVGSPGLIVQRITLVTPSLQYNSLGRAYCLWLLADANGWDAEVVAPSGEDVWLPLRDTEFARACRVVRRATFDAFAAGVASASDLLVGVKAEPASALLFERLRQITGLPGFIDVDDPDLDAYFASGNRGRKLAREILRPTWMARARKAHRLAQRHVATVSNPVLAELYGGQVLPHVRLDTGPGSAHVSHDPVIAFVGTDRPHKGLQVLRQAVEALQSERFTLVVTGQPPADRRPWERWVGATSLSEGLRLVMESDIVAIPSLQSQYARAQLPVKLLDAMLAARAVVVTRVGPLPWAVGPAGVVVEPDSPRELARALSALRDPTVRADRGNAARSFALSRYTVDAQKARFRVLCEEAGVRGTQLEPPGDASHQEASE